MPRLATGLKRQIPFQMQFDPEEDEYTKRLMFEKRYTSRAAMIRDILFKTGWQENLVKLRAKQRHIPKVLQKEFAA